LSYSAVLQTPKASHCSPDTIPDGNWTTKFRNQQTSHMEPPASSTTVTGPVGEHLQVGTEDAPVLDRPAPLRRFLWFWRRI